MQELRNGITPNLLGESHIYNKECIEVFLVKWTFSKVVFVRNAHGHVLKMPFGAGTKAYVAVLA